MELRTVDENNIDEYSDIVDMDVAKNIGRVYYHGLAGATVFRFKVQRGSDVLSSILKIWAPDQCKTVAMGDGEFLMISGPVKDSLSERFIELLTEQVKNRGIPMDAAYETDYDAAIDAIISRYV